MNYKKLIRDMTFVWIIVHVIAAWIYWLSGRPIERNEAAAITEFIAAGVSTLVSVALCIAHADFVGDRM
jgi:hypothetical protein